MEAYIEEIERLITENQTVKDQNRKFKKILNQLIHDIQLFFTDMFPELLPYNHSSLDTSLYSILPHYRREILAMRLDLKNQLSKILILFESQPQEELNESLSLSETQMVTKFRKNLVEGKHSLMSKYRWQIEEKNKGKQEVKKLEKETYNISLQLKKAEMLLSEKQAEIQQKQNEIKVLKVEFKGVQNGVQNLKYKSEELQKENSLLHEEVNELHFKNTALRHEILKKEKEGNNL